MLERFKCPDGEEIKIEDCLQKCRMASRCVAKPLLIKMAEVREWKGQPSTTQLLNGTYEAFLKIVTGFSDEPDSLIYSFLGTGVHSYLDTAKGDGVQTEDVLGQMTSEDGVTGRPDLVVDENDQLEMIDYKVCGSFQITKALGLTFELVPSETEVYSQKSYTTDAIGNKMSYEKGSPKMERKYFADPSKADIFNWSMQLNHYRILYEQKTSKKIDKLTIQAIVRDGGLAATMSRGVYKKSYLIPIPIIDNQIVLDYFRVKKDNLLQALAQFDWNEKCSDFETWSGKKCESYCSVSHVCKFMTK